MSDSKPRATGQQPGRPVFEAGGDDGLMYETIDAKRNSQLERIFDPKLLADIIDFLPAAVWIKNEESRFVFSNKRHSDLTGVPEAILLGNTSELYLGREGGAKSRERDIALLESGENTSYETVETFAGNIPRHIKIHRSKLTDSAGKSYILGVTVDVTESRHNEARLRMIADTSPLGIVQMMENGDVPFANAHALAILGLGERDDAETLAKIPAMLDTGRRGFPGVVGKFEMTLGEGSEGERRILIISSGWRGIATASGRTAMVSIVDISEMMELRRINDEVSRLNNELAANVKRLAEAQRELIRKGRLEQLAQLTAKVAHELRNPLSAMRTSAYVLDKKLRAKNPECETQIDRIFAGITRCNNIITQLIDFAHARPLLRQPVEFDSWLEGFVREEAATYPEAVAIVCDLGLGGETVEIDTGRMGRAVANLLANAVEAMARSGGPAPGEVPLNATVAIRTALSKGMVILEVSDNGPGMAAEILDHIREPLFTTKNFGTGLGVPAVEKIAEQHGGTLEIWSEPGQGSRFTLRWPLDQNRAAA